MYVFYDFRDKWIGGGAIGRHCFICLHSQRRCKRAFWHFHVLLLLHRSLKIALQCLVLHLVDEVANAVGRFAPATIHYMCCSNPFCLCSSPSLLQQQKCSSSHLAAHESSQKFITHQIWEKIPSFDLHIVCCGLCGENFFLLLPLLSPYCCLCRCFLSRN